MWTSRHDSAVLIFDEFEYEPLLLKTAGRPQRARVKIRISPMTATTLQARTAVFSGRFAACARAWRAADHGKILNYLVFFDMGRGSVAVRARFLFERLCHNWRRPQRAKIQVLRALLFVSRSERKKFFERKNRVVPVQTGDFHIAVAFVS